jgi:FkbM family methyltransferase
MGIMAPDEATMRRTVSRDRSTERVGKAALHLIFRALVGWWPLGRRFEAALVVLSGRHPESRVLHILRIHWTLSAPRRDHLRTAKLVTGAQILIRLVPGQDQIYYSGVYEPATTAVLMTLARPGDLVIDVGANVGYFSILCASLGAEVHAFEPEPEVAEQLHRSADLNDFPMPLRVNLVALADRPGPHSLHRSPAGVHTGNSSLLRLPHLSNVDALNVETDTLDHYFQTHRLRRARALKIDVEGAERLVLSGASDLLQSEARPDVIICEVWSSDEGGGRRQIIDLLGQVGYQPHVQMHGRLVALTEYDGKVLPSGDENIVFVHRQASL